jgi:peptide/nickel transport system ATP-binding protein
MTAHTNGRAAAAGSPSSQNQDATMPGTEQPRLRVEALTVRTAGKHGRTGSLVVNGVSFRVLPGQVLGLVGESGSGKTTAALAVLGHVRRGLTLSGGQVILDGTDILGLPQQELQRLRGRTVAYVPQDPASALNPTLKIGMQLREVLAAHSGADAREQRLAEVLGEAGLSDVSGVLHAYPHQLSGGQQQRVALAMAFACRPRLIVLDEPTTGLDVITQRRILDTVLGLCRSYQVAALYISHDLAVIAEMSDQVAVMYAGHLVEVGPAAEVFAAPAHPYTRGLLRSVPTLARAQLPRGLAGNPPQVGAFPPGCAFEPRCEFAVPSCAADQPLLLSLSPSGQSSRCFRAREIPALSQTAERPAPERPRAAADSVILSVSGLGAAYGGQRVLHDLDLSLPAGRCLAIAGMSGSGKTTLARCIVGLHTNWTGQLAFAGKQLPPGVRHRDREQLRRVQYISQNPYSSLNPRRTIGQIVEQPLAHFSKKSAVQRRQMVEAALAAASLPAEMIDRYPDQLSGGQRQRVAIARAIIVEPDLLICDEVTSALDVSVQAAIAELLRRLQAERGLSLLFITHNLPLVRSVADDVAVMNKGRICEHGPVGEVLAAPRDPYTVQLLADAPKMTAATDRDSSRAALDFAESATRSSEMTHQEVADD